jgi:S-adenosylmethionine synthetase
MPMYPQDMLFTSESVTEGHPDKLCDQISDAVVDECLRHDPASRVACETYATMGLVVVGGEVTTRAVLDVAALVRGLAAEIGYTGPQFGFDAHTCAVASLLHAQSPDIAQGVARGDDTLGAGDQGLMFGFACRQTPELMPLPIVLAHRLVRRLAEVRKGGVLPWLGPDGKAQVTIEYRDGGPRRAAWVVVAAQHTAEAVTPDGRFTSEEAKRAIVDTVVLPVLGDLVDADTTITVNGTGTFLIGGPQADTGMTGRKNIVDTYGGWAPHGGGAFSGKDPTKVDRSAGYMARYIAKNLVAAELAEHCLVQLAYCIGLADPVSVMVNTHGTGARPDDDLAAVVRRVFPLSPAGIIDRLALRRPIYRGTAAYGHFGRTDADFPWERIDAVDSLLAAMRMV